MPVNGLPVCVRLIQAPHPAANPAVTKYGRAHTRPRSCTHGMAYHNIRSTNVAHIRSTYGTYPPTTLVCDAGAGDGRDCDPEMDAWGVGTKGGSRQAEGHRTDTEALQGES